MFGIEYHWLATHLRFAAQRLRIARWSLGAALLAGCVAMTALSFALPCVGQVALAAAPAPDLDPATEWPRVVLHFWLLLPQLLGR